MLRHQERNLVTSVHGDDFTSSGPKAHLDWMKSQMEAKYELKELARLGPAKDDGKEVKVLNRLVRWTETGIEYEADPRQIERLVVDL